MKIIASSLVGLALLATSARADSIQQLADRADDAAQVLRDWNRGSIDEQIPHALLDRAQCVVVIPHIYKAAWMLSVRYGKGLASCRNSVGTWSNPVFFQLTGIGFGFQGGLQASDIVLVLPRDNAAERLSRPNITLGGDLSIAAGPIGRRAEASTDWILQSEIYSYSRNRGVFAGASLEGASLRANVTDNRTVYGSHSSVLGQMSTMQAPPAIVSDFVAALNSMAR